MNTTNSAKLVPRLGIYCLGLLILAFGIALGTCTTLIYALYVLLQMVIGRKFQPTLLLQLVFSTIFGYEVIQRPGTAGAFSAFGSCNLKSYS